MKHPSPVRGESLTTSGSLNDDYSAVAAERRILEYGLACAERARGQVMEARQRISESLSLMSQEVAS